MSRRKPLSSAANAALATPREFGLRLGELFAGAGGVAYGFKKAGFLPTWAIDADPDACDTYRRNIGAHAINRRVEDVDFSRLPPVDGLAFGFPCNDFSMAGDRKGTSGYFGGLYRQAERALREIRPAWFIAENVPGLMSSGGMGILNEFATAGDGYNVSVHLFKFEEHGVAQRRWRIIAVGTRAEYGLTFLPPYPTHIKRVRTSATALKGVETARHNNELPRHRKRTIEFLGEIPEGSNAWDEAVPIHLRLNVDKCRLSLIYRRLHRNEPAYTIVAAGGGGTHMYHYDEPRALTNRERARLQSFPDSFVFCGSQSSVRKQIGMAVPPRGSFVIARALRRLLEGRRYPATENSHGILRASQLDLALPG